MCYPVDIFIHGDRVVNRGELNPAKEGKNGKNINYRR
jgi:uncharacterized protein (DUF779 family)